MKGGGLSRFEEARQEKFKRYKSLRYSSFNTTQPGDGSFNLIDIVGDEEKEEAHARRPMGRNIWKNNDAKIPMDPGTKLVKVEDGNSVDATYYRSLIGSLRYLLHTRPDLSYSVGLLNRFMQDPKDHHLKAVKQVIRYINGTKEHGIIYKKEGGCKITSYSDSSYGINTDQGKGTTGIVFYFGESPITWCTQKQPTVALSSCESEFMAATRAACQALWLKRLLSELTGWEEKMITLKVDNVSAIALVKNPVFH
ncbi:hypothetical protein Tco_1403964 [Tanacetum coccineum]